MKAQYIPRKMENTLDMLVKQFPVVALTGPRQSGKSTLLKKKFSHYNYLSFDDPVIREQAISDPNLFLDNAGKQAIIDEIQYVPELTSYIKIRVDNNRQQKGMYLITGSQQFSLIKNLGDSLAGRVALIELMPFCLNEIKKIKYLHTIFKNQIEYFIHFCLRGGFPEVVLNKNLQASIWYSSYIQTYLERDIRNIYNIGSIRDFQRFLTILASRCAQILNLSALSNDIGVSLNTIKKWISILEASRIIFLLPAYYNNFGKRITKMSKVYFTDCGLICYLTGIKSRDHLLNGPMGGALFENFCIQETLKIFLNNALRPSMYYIRTNNSLEVDLIIETAYQTIFPIEIKLTKTVKSAMALPIEKINRIFPKLNFQKGRVISLSKSQTKLTSFVSNQNLDDYFIWLEGLCKRD